MSDFYRDAEGKISSTKLSPYGKKQLGLLEGVKIYFTDGVVTIKGNKLVRDGKVLDTINNDRLVNKLLFKIM